MCTNFCLHKLLQFIIDRNYLLVHMLFLEDRWCTVYCANIC